ncbi:MAG: hypothetical protein AAGC56_02050 [Pseudomonadota bacterium]
MRLIMGAMAAWAMAAWALAGCALAGCVLAAGEARADENWAKVAASDVRSAHQIMLDNHPGPVDPENPNFLPIAEEALAAALQRAEAVSGPDGYAAVLLGYTAYFRDGHFAVYAPDLDDATSRWPGFIVAWRPGLGYVVADAASDERGLKGAALLDCDGRDGDALMKESVFAFSPAKPDQIAYRVHNARHLFHDTGNPFAPAPAVCAFRLPSGGYKLLALDWRDTPDDFYERGVATAFGEGPDETRLRKVRDGTYWITLPDFSPDADEIERLRELFERLIEDGDAVRNAEAIVIDVRGNGGGSSAWGDDFVEALWGVVYAGARPKPSSTAVDWRASPANLAYLKRIVPILKEQGQTDLVEDYVEPIIAGLAGAVDAGAAYYRETDEDPETPLAPAPLNPVRADVYVLTPGDCASACLDFLDRLFAVGDVTHIGFPTFSDTNYLEVRQQDLPSGHGKIAVPLKVYRGRARASGAVYEPAARYDGLDWSDDAIRDWVFSVIDGS